MAPPAALLQQNSSRGGSMRRGLPGSIQPTTANNHQLNNNSSSQPPSQVYTMGSVGKVKTRPHNVQSLPASTINTHSHHQQQQQQQNSSYHRATSTASTGSSKNTSNSHSSNNNSSSAVAAGTTTSGSGMTMIMMPRNASNRSNNSNHVNKKQQHLERQRSMPTPQPQSSSSSSSHHYPSKTQQLQQQHYHHHSNKSVSSVHSDCNRTVKSVSSNTSTTSRSSRHSHNSAATPATVGSSSGRSATKQQQQQQHAFANSKAVSFEQHASLVDFHERHKLHVRATRRIVEDLTRSQGSYERRIAAITNACETFDHADESLHNTELHQGAATALSRLLGLSTSDDELRMICAALEMVFRGNPKSVQAAYERIPTSNNSSSGSLLLTHLLRLLARCEAGNMNNARISIVNISRILLYLSRCSPLRSSLARHPGLVASLTNNNSAALQLLSTTSSSSTPAAGAASPATAASNSSRMGGMSGASPSANSTMSTTTTNTQLQHQSYGNSMVDCRLTRIRTIANLCKCDDNKLYLYEQEGLLDTILRTAHLDQHAAARHHAAVALMELAAATHNQTALAHDDVVLGTAVKMILLETAAQTRESVITALQNLAFSKQNRWRLVTFKQGIVLEALKKALASDVDAKARRRAAGSLTNLACQQTAERIGSHKGLLDTLAFCATKDSSKEVQTRAALALTKIANGITVDMPCHAALLDALVVASLSDATNSISAVLRVKSREPENRQVLARHPGILDTLSDICLSDTSSVNERDNAVRSLMHLVNEDRNRKIMCNKTILDALVASAAYKDPDLHDARDSAIRAMERLATEFTNRAYMAKHKNLLVVVASAVEREAVWEEEGEKSEHGFLAKPLLMSLLVAM